MASAKLTTEQQNQVHAWADEGADMNVIQDRLKNELGVTLTFMETRFLLSDLGITLRTPTDEEEPAQAKDLEEEDAMFPPGMGSDSGAWDEAGEELPPFADGLPEDAAAGQVALTVDEITIPGAIASGKVTFTDGKNASWYLDQMGRLGLSGVERTYQPPEADLIAFQKELQNALRRAGY